MAGWALGMVGLGSSQGHTVNRLDVAIDTGRFRATGGRSNLEVYLGIDRALLTYDRDQGQPDVTLAAVVLLKQRGQVVDFRELQVRDVLGWRTENPKGRIPKRATFTLAPGTYLLQVVVEDQLGIKFDSTFQVEVPAYREWGLDMSTVQLAALVQRAGSRQDEFFKHGLAARPQATAIFGGDHPLLWYLAVVYGVTHLDTVEIEATIWQDSLEVFSTGPKRTLSPALTYVDRGAINVSALSPGTYRLEIKAAAAGDSTAGTTPFQVVGSGAAPGDSGDGLAGLSPDDLMGFALGLDAAWPRLDVNRIQAEKVAARGAMVRRFTGELATIVGQDSSAYLGELLHRWPKVIAFDHLRQAADSLSQQGRTMFLYGMPETVAVYPATRTQREYQIWAYPSPDSSRQVIFIDGDGDGHLALVHATLPGAAALGWERNEDWRQQLPWGSVAEKVSAPTTPPAAGDPLPETIRQADSLTVDTSLIREGRPDTLLMDATLGDTTMEDTTVNRLIPDEPGQIDTLASPVSVQTSNAPKGDSLTSPPNDPDIPGNEAGFPTTVPGDTAGVEPTRAP